MKEKFTATTHNEILVGKEKNWEYAAHTDTPALE